MALPISPPRTYVDGEPLPADDVTEAMVAICESKFADVPIPLAACAWRVVNTATPVLTDGLWACAATTVFECPISLRVGDEIAGISIGYNRGGSGQVTLSLYRRPIADGSVAPALMKNRAISDASGSSWENPTYTDLNLTSTDPLGTAGANPPGEVIQAGYTYWWRVSCSNTTTFAGGIMTARKL